jgi:hypothetical protein
MAVFKLAINHRWFSDSAPGNSKWTRPGVACQLPLMVTVRSDFKAAPSRGCSWRASTRVRGLSLLLVKSDFKAPGSCIQQQTPLKLESLLHSAGPVEQHTSKGTHTAAI